MITLIVNTRTGETMPERPCAPPCIWVGHRHIHIAGHTDFEDVVRTTLENPRVKLIFDSSFVPSEVLGVTVTKDN